MDQEEGVKRADNMPFKVLMEFRRPAKGQEGLSPYRPLFGTTFRVADVGGQLAVGDSVEFTKRREEIKFN